MPQLPTEPLRQFDELFTIKTGPESLRNELSELRQDVTRLLATIQVQNQRLAVLEAHVNIPGNRILRIRISGDGLTVIRENKEGLQYTSQQPTEPPRDWWEDGTGED
jgi:hypothetical protein